MLAEILSEASVILSNIEAAQRLLRTISTPLRNLMQYLSSGIGHSVTGITYLGSHMTHECVGLLHADGGVPLPRLDIIRQQSVEWASHTNPKGTTSGKRPREEDISIPAKRHHDDKSKVHVKVEKDEELSEFYRVELTEMEV